MQLLCGASDGGGLGPSTAGQTRRKADGGHTVTKPHVPLGSLLTGVGQNFWRAGSHNGSYDNLRAASPGTAQIQTDPVLKPGAAQPTELNR